VGAVIGAEAKLMSAEHLFECFFFAIDAHEISNLQVLQPNGMEEVIGSIPIRSTSHFNHLQAIFRGDFLKPRNNPGTVRC
jgi:hypothetical protein